MLAAIDGCDAIIHGGDINKPEIIERLQEITPVYVVRGNNDKAWAEHIPATLTFRIEDCQFFLVHNKKEVPKDLTDIDAVIFGHSHKYFEENGVLDGIFVLLHQVRIAGLSDGGNADFFMGISVVDFHKFLRGAEQIRKFTK